MKKSYRKSGDDFKNEIVVNRTYVIWVHKNSDKTS